MACDAAGGNIGGYASGDIDNDMDVNEDEYFEEESNNQGDISL